MATATRTLSVILDLEVAPATAMQFTVGPKDGFR